MIAFGRPVAKTYLVVAFLFLTAVSAAGQDLRLDANVRPTGEEIRLRIDADLADYSGSVVIDLEVLASTRSFSFHAQELNMESVILTGPAGPIDVTWDEGQTGIVTATTTELLVPGAYTLSVHFTNDFDSRTAGLYRVEVGGHAYAYTQFEAWDARRALPVWDEPRYKIPFRVTLEVPETHEAVSNTPIEAVTRSEGMKVVRFAPTPPMPSYLLAFATGPFDSVTIPGLSVPGRIVTVQGSTALASLAANMAPPLLSALERYFDRPYPYSKLDLIAVPEFSYGAMENPGAITFLDRLLLVPETGSSIQERMNLAHGLTHEFAHMWFGDLVTMTWWDDLWLNESFADWLTFKVVDEVHPEFDITTAAEVDVQSILEADALPSSRPIRRDVDPSAGPVFFDNLVYVKGRTVLKMIEQWIGESRFRTGVRNYLDAHAWGNATASDLWTLLSDAAGRDVQPVLSTFLDQAGVPLIEADFPEPDLIRFRQRRLLPFGTAAEPQTWSIPVTFRYADKGGAVHTNTVLLEEAVASFPLEGGVGDWIHLNSNLTGYYRWSLPPDRMRDLARVAVTVLEVPERAALANDAGVLLDSGVLDSATYLGIVEALAQDPNAAIIRGAGVELRRIAEDFTAETETDGQMAAFIGRTLESAMERVGLEKRDGEAPTMTAIRAPMIGFLGGSRGGADPRVRAYARDQTARYLEDPSRIDATMAQFILRVAAEEDPTLFDRYLAGLESAREPGVRAAYLSALGAFRDPDVVAHALDYVLRGPLRPQEVTTILQTISELQPQRRDELFDWVMANYATILSRATPVSATFIPWLANGASLDRVAKAEDFFVGRDDAPPGTLEELAKVGDEVRHRVELREREGAGVRSFLQR